MSGREHVDLTVPLGGRFHVAEIVS
jgi:hypothetical protein